MGKADTDVVKHWLVSLNTASYLFLSDWTLTDIGQIIPFLICLQTWSIIFNPPPIFYDGKNLLNFIASKDSDDTVRDDTEPLVHDKLMNQG